jgi:hypothetical protein
MRSFEGNVPFLPGRDLLGGAVLGCLLSISANAPAVDAYDDEAPEVQPEGLSEDEDERSERVGVGLEAGGLEAPEAMPETGDRRNDAERSLDEADEKDAGRGLEFAYLKAEVGYQIVGLATVSNGGLFSKSADVSERSLMFSVGAGMRVLYFTLGARFRRMAAQDFGLWTLGGELGIRVPIGSLEPFGIFEVGYAKVFGLDYASLEPTGEQEEVNVRGMNVRLGGGLDYYFSDSFSVGGQVTGELLFLRRLAKGAPSVCEGQSDCPYDEEGSGVGAGLTTSLVVGLHF